MTLVLTSSVKYLKHVPSWHTLQRNTIMKSINMNNYKGVFIAESLPGASAPVSKSDSLLFHQFRQQKQHGEFLSPLFQIKSMLNKHKNTEIRPITRLICLKGLIIHLVGLESNLMWFLSSVRALIFEFGLNVFINWTFFSEQTSLKTWTWCSCWTKLRCFWSLTSL